jgi:hypothetical protein
MKKVAVSSREVTRRKISVGNHERHPALMGIWVEI